MRSLQFATGVFLSASVAVACLALPVRAAGAPDWRANLTAGNERLQGQQLKEAQTCFEAALSGVRRDSKASAAERAECMQALAGVLHRQMQIEDVIPLDRKSLRILERAYGKKSARVVPTLILLGDVFESEGQYRKAVKFYKRALAIASKDPGADSTLYAQCAHLLGRASFKAGSAVAGDENYRSALSVLMRQKELSSSDLLLEVMADYIDLLSRVGGLGKPLGSSLQKELWQDRLGELPRTQAAAPSHWQMHVSAKLGASAPQTAEDVSAPAIRPDRALPDFEALETINKQRVDFYERMIAVDIKTLGEDHPSCARDLSGLAAIYLSQRQYDQAKPLLLRALRIYTNVYGDQSQVTKRTQHLLDLLAAEGGPHAGAALVPAPEYAGNLPVIPLAAQKLEVALSLNYLAFVLYCQGKTEQADQVYAWALSGTARACGPDSLVAAACMTDYTSVLRSAGKAGEAEHFEEVAQAILRRDMLKQAASELP